MRIAMLTNNYKPFVGGVPISVERQARELTKRGHEVTVFAPQYTQDCEDHREGTNDPGEGSYRVIRFKTGRLRMENGVVYPRTISPEILDGFKKQQFDCIHVHHPMCTGPMALYLGRRYNLPVIYTYHTKYEDYLHYLGPFRNMEKKGAMRKRLYKIGREKVVPGYMRWFTNRCDLVLAPTESMRRSITSKGTKTPAAIFPTGLEDSFFEGDELKSEEIRSSHLAGCEYLFCSVSRLEEEKNPRFLLQGIAELKKRLGKPFKVLLIGDGSMKKKLVQMAGELNIAEETVFLGNIDNQEIKYYLGACDLFLFASKSETQGIVLAEAQAAGLPVVAVKATGVEDIVLDGKNGYATEEDAVKWAQKILLALDNENHGRLTKEARKSAAAFRSSRLAVYEESLYAQCIKEKEKEDRAYENQRNWTQHTKSSINRLFKTS